MPICERAMMLLPQMTTYVKAVARGKAVDPKTKSFEVVKQGIADVLMPAKLHFYLSVAKQVVPFLTMYQTDKPMVPFINADLFRMLKVLISRFMKPASLSLITSSAQLLKLDVDKKESHLDVVLRGTTVLPRHRGTICLRYQYRRLYGTI